MGLSPSATSYHLRALARAGLVEAAPGRGDGRERWWRISAGRYEVSGVADLAPEGREALRALLESLLAWDDARVRRYLSRLDAEPGEWQDAAFFMDSTLQITARELTALGQAVGRTARPVPQGPARGPALRLPPGLRGRPRPPRLTPHPSPPRGAVAIRTRRGSASRAQRASPGVPSGCRDGRVGGAARSAGAGGHGTGRRGGGRGQPGQRGRGVLCPGHAALTAGVYGLMDSVWVSASVAGGWWVARRRPSDAGLARLLLGSLALTCLGVA